MHKTVFSLFAFLAVFNMTHVALAGSSKVTNIFDLCAFGNVKQVEKALKHGAKINVADASGFTPLMYAMQNKDVRILQFLLDKGARLDVTASFEYGDGMTPLMRASYFGNMDVIVFLIKSGVNVNAKDSCGGTALMYAAESSPRAVLNALIRAGARIDERMDNGMSALMIAAQSNQSPDVISLFLSAGANVSFRDDQGRTAADYATGNPKIYNSEFYRMLCGTRK